MEQGNYVDKDNEPVFVIGCPRTGSKIYLNAISNNSEVNISPELHILNPRWLHPDFVRTVENRIGTLNDQKSKDKLLQLIDEEKFYGSFWHMNRINTTSLKERLENREWIPKEIFKAILEEDAEQNNGGGRIGAKFPVHFSYIPKLIEWFPNCKVIHLTRDPRAIYNSQLFKYYNKEKNKNKKYLLRCVILFYIIIIYKWDYKVYNNYRYKENIMLSRYEDIVFHFDSQMKKICNFIGINYTPEMKKLPLIGSSFAENEKGVGINSASVARYKENLTKLEIKFIELCCRKEMKQRGYL